MAILVAITRAVSPAITRCELTHLERMPISPGRAAAQHQAYQAALRDAGVVIQALPSEPDMPDAVFVEDVAVVTRECAIITRPGAESRRAECESVARALAEHRELHAIETPGTLDGGDVLVVGSRVFVGLTARTNPEGARQLGALLGRHGYAVQPVAVSGCLHLKSAATCVAPETLLVHPAWLDPARFERLERIEIDSTEPYAANALRVGETVFVQPAFPRTRERLEHAGIRTALLDQSELAKAEGGLTCCSILFEG